MQEPIALLGTPHMGFFALIIIGGLAGWIAGMVIGIRHGIFTNILIGIVGSWIGSEIASILGIAVGGSMAHFLAALAGSVFVIMVWQALHGRSTPGLPTR